MLANIYYFCFKIKSIMLKSKQVISSGVAHNALAPGTVIKGNVHAEEDFRIDGTVEGNIECSGKVIIGPQAQISGNIRCQNADLMGKINGNVEIEGTLKLRSSVVFVGEVVAKNLEIEAGATFNGTCKML